MKWNEACSYKAEISEMEDIYAFISRFFAARGVPERIVRVMETAADEIFSNIVHYAFDKPRNEAIIGIELGVNDGMAEMTFRDSGVPFDPTAAPPPDVTQDADERRAGGLGIYITRTLVDEMTYSCQDRRNVLTLKKHIDG
jgi:anti-sigma regulatory factor (Ser/Thr protein kinase)